MIFSYYGANTGSSQAQVTEAQQSARSAERRTAELAEQVDKLTIICAAMWELLQEKTGLSEQQLADRMAEIDLRDGTADGKITATARTCGKCGRRVAMRHMRCLYCGEPVQVESVFETLT